MIIQILADQWTFNDSLIEDAAFRRAPSGRFFGQKNPICFMSPVIHWSGSETRNVVMAQ